LRYLAERPGQVVPREELEASVWAGLVVGYDALTSAIIKLRKAFDDDSRKPKFIETVSKRGYRLIATVQPADAEANADALDQTVLHPSPWARVSRIQLGAGFVALLILVILFWIYLPTAKGPTPALPDKPSLVVLPFTNLGDGKADGYLAEGITEDIATDLSKYSGIEVISLYSASFYRQPKPVFSEIHKNLGVDYVVTGSLQRWQNQLRVNVQLVDAADGKRIWAERFDAPMQQIFDVQDRVRREVVQALALPLTNEEKRFAARRYTNDMEAYNFFLLARASYGRHTRESNQQARQYLQMALSIDPQFARAYSLLALTHTDDFRFSWSTDPMQSVEAAEQAALKAIKLDDRLPQAHWVLGNVYLFGLKRHKDAIEQGLLTLRLDPNHADGHLLLAVTYIYMGQPQLTVQYAAQAMRLNPHYSSQYPAVMGYAQYFLKNYEEARKYLEQAVQMNPGRLPPSVYLLANTSAMGDAEEAAWQFSNLRLIDKNFNVDDWAGRQPFADKALLEKIVADLKKAEPKS